MIFATIIASAVGVILFLIIALSYNKLLQKNESGFLHLLMALMYACWLPIPMVMYYQLRDYEFLIVGTVFGFVSILILALTMVLQASHLTYSAYHHKEDTRLWDRNDSWMLNGLLGGQVELLANVLRGIWVIFVTICFWLRGDILLFSFGVIFSLFACAYMMRLIDSSLVREIRFLKLVKLSYIIINLETFGWFLMLTVWLVASV
jgi:hypothetical protein